MGGIDGSEPPVRLDLVTSDLDAQVADLVFAGRYIPAGLGPEPIAGDFYDLLVLDDDRVAVVVGDVAGHGTTATVRMQQLRAAARAYALLESAPASVIYRLDMFCKRLEPESIATVWYGVYHASSGTLTYASAGHPPPVLAVHHGPQLLEPSLTPPLGVGAADEVVGEHSLVLPVGAILVAYSDGLIERRGADYDEQVSLLRAVVAAACDPARAGDATAIANEILTALVPDAARAEDDVCLLVVRREAPR